MKELHYYYREYAQPSVSSLLCGEDDEGPGRSKDLSQKRRSEPPQAPIQINNVLGQVLLAKRMGKKRIIAETGAGQHGVATATAAALFDMECVVYMGAEDVERQSLNAYRMELLGAKVVAVESGTEP